MRMLKTAIVASAVALAMGTTAAYADAYTNSTQQRNAQASQPAQPMTGKEKATAIGAGSGAVAGAVVGGPIGAVVGAGVGAVVGHEGTDANGHVDSNATKSAHAWSNGDVAKAQTALNEKGYDVAVDGKYGPNTATAVRSFQADNGMAANGTLDDATLKALGVKS